VRDLTRTGAWLGAARHRGAGKVTRYPLAVRQRALLMFVVANFLAAGLHAQRFLFAEDARPSGLGLAFAALGLLAQVGLVTLALHAVLCAVALVDSWALVTRCLASLAFTLLQTFIYVDARIYGFFRFHFNALALNVLLTPGGFESMELPTRDVAMASAGIAILLGVELLGYTALLRWARAATWPIRRRWVALVATVLALVASERLAYAAGDLLDIPGVARQARLIPFYEPLRLREVRQRLRIRGDAGALAYDPRQSALNYPQVPVIGTVRADHRWNVVWILIESWRADTLTLDNTPNIWRFSRQAQVFRQHLSGGNSTRFGIFSMIYGLHGTYWWPFLAEGREPVLITKLAEAGYRFRILASTSLGYPEFRRTAFVSVRPFLTDRLPGQTVADRDVLQARAFETFLDETPREDAFFGFLFFGAPHFPFLFPPEHAKFLPILEKPTIAQAQTPEGGRQMYNRYRNSIHSVDSVVGSVLAALERRGLLDRTIVVVTGDHGQEFYEHGFFGHGSAFTPEQTRVPLVMHVPGLSFHEHDHLTQHQDLPATMLALLGIDDPPEGYSLGRSMLEGRGRPYAVVCGFRECALQDSEGWVVFGVEGKTSLSLEARDRDYVEIAASGPAVTRRLGYLMAIMREMRFFVR
jgi:membrane-anchored protein YejM (alkaline phosphatase superfamily)